MRAWGNAAAAFAGRCGQSAGALLALYVLLDVAAALAWPLIHPEPVPHGGPLIAPLVIFFAWRVSRGGRISRVLLIIQGALSYATAVLTVARSWDAFVLLLLVLYAAQVAVLFSPAVCRRAGRGVPRLGREHLMPPAWLLATGLLAGLIVTLLYLGSGGFIPVPGCAAPGAVLAQLPDRCITLAEGYPLRFLSAAQNMPLINRHALIKDWAQWALASLSVLYGLWLQRGPQPSLRAQLTRRQRASASP